MDTWLIKWKKSITMGLAILFFISLSTLAWSWGPKPKSSQGFGTSSWGARAPCPTGASGGTCDRMGAQSSNTLDAYTSPKTGVGTK